jgi:general secretion pathway protein N
MTSLKTHPHRQTAKAALAGALLGIVMALWVFAPARWLGQALSEWTQGRLSLEAARGTVWQGSAQLWLRGGAGSQDARGLPGRIHWHLQWQGLSTLALQIQAPCCASQVLALTLQPGWGQLTATLANSHFLGSADLLAGLGAPWNTLDLQGQLQLDSEQLSLTLAQGRLQVQGQAVLQALDISSKLSTLQPLGSYQLVLSGGNTPQLKLNTVSGGLQLEGEGQWVGGQLHFHGQAQAAPERESALNNLLNVIGQREGHHSRISLG